jgi:hypothetical protein
VICRLAGREASCTRGAGGTSRPLTMGGGAFREWLYVAYALVLIQNQNGKDKAREVVGEH